MPLAIATHLFAAVIWIGGMFFAYLCLRPSLAGILQPPQPAQLWQAVLGRFFRWVWVAVITLLVSGLWMAFTRYGPMGDWPLWLHIMFGLGIAMMLVFLQAFFTPFRRLQGALTTGDGELAVRSIGQIRRLVAINLCLGLIVLLAASSGRYL